MILEKINHKFSICKVKTIDPEILNEDFTFLSKTDHELSLICRTELVPADVLEVEHEWGCFRIAEDAAFEKYGMIAFLTQIIANEKTGVLVVATYDTDYLLIKSSKLDAVYDALQKNGCQFL